VSWPDVRFTPESDRSLRRREMTLCAITDQSAVHQKWRYSITSSAVSIMLIGKPTVNSVAIGGRAEIANRLKQSARDRKR
jgi:hypothetical protein